MQAAIKGYYDNGCIYMEEQAPVSSRTEVMIVFLNDEKKPEKPKQRIPGGLKGKVSIPDDFNEPLDELKDYM